MGLDYSQSRLVSSPLTQAKGRHNKKKTERLQMYAFFTGLMSTLISLAGTIIIALKH